jgi:hypothetical protein
MRPFVSILVAMFGGFLIAVAVSAATLAPSKASDSRRLNVVREYTIPVTKGQKTVAAIPALMSFWGATNQQVVLQSDFTYSVKPDKIEITADDRGMPRRNYELTWDSPQVDSITVTQKMVVELGCASTLSTAAKLPYPQAVAERFASLLAKDDNVNPGNPQLEPICKEVRAKAVYAEDAAELVCDWINDNVQFKSGAGGPSDKILADGQGNCFGMAHLACALLRRLGIPAAIVSAKFIGGDGGHGFIEAYFPDAGWVFYDLSNADRGYKCLDVLMTAGWSFRVGDGKKYAWHDGYFCVEKDAMAYKEVLPGIVKLRPTPKSTVIGVKVTHENTPNTVRVRHEPLCELVMDLAVLPGKRDYVKEQMSLPAKADGKPTASVKSP